MWQSRPTNSDDLAATFLFVEDNMQDVDTFKGVETAVRQGTVSANMSWVPHFLPGQRLRPAALQTAFSWSGSFGAWQLPILPTTYCCWLCYAT